MSTRGTHSRGYGTNPDAHTYVPPIFYQRFIPNTHHSYLLIIPMFLHLRLRWQTAHYRYRQMKLRNGTLPQNGPLRIGLNHVAATAINNKQSSKQQLGDDDPCDDDKQYPTTF